MLNARYRAGQPFNASIFFANKIIHSALYSHNHLRLSLLYVQKMVETTVTSSSLDYRSASTDCIFVRRDGFINKSLINNLRKDNLFLTQK